MTSLGQWIAECHSTHILDVQYCAVLRKPTATGILCGTGLRNSWLWADLSKLNISFITSCSRSTHKSGRGKSVKEHLLGQWRSTEASHGLFLMKLVNYTTTMNFWSCIIVWLITSNALSQRVFISGVQGEFFSLICGTIGSEHRGLLRSGASSAGLQHRLGSCLIQCGSV